MKFLYILFTFPLVIIDSPDCNMEKSEVNIYRKRTKDKYVNKLTENQVPSGKLMVEFGFGFGDDIIVNYNDSIVFEDTLESVDYPMKGFVINVKEKKSEIYFKMLSSKICAKVEINSKYRMLYVTRFKDVWYFTYSNYSFPRRGNVYSIKSK